MQMTKGASGQASRQWSSPRLMSLSWTQKGLFSEMSQTFIVLSELTVVSMSGHCVERASPFTASEWAWRVHRGLESFRTSNI